MSGCEVRTRAGTAPAWAQLQRRAEDEAAFETKNASDWGRGHLESGEFVSKGVQDEAFAGLQRQNVCAFGMASYTLVALYWDGINQPGFAVLLRDVGRDAIVGVANR